MKELGYAILGFMGILFYGVYMCGYAIIETFKEIIKKVIDIRK